MFELSEIQRDALMEVFNIGVGRASRNLSSLLNCETALSAPIIVQTLSTDAGKIVDPTMLQSKDACMVSRLFSGIDAESIMIFQGPRQNVIALMFDEIDSGVVSDSGRNVATQIADLVSKSCAEQMENLMGIKVQMSPVTFLTEVPEKVFNVRNQKSDILFIVKIDISLRRRGITSHFLMSFTEDSANILLDGVDRWINEETLKNKPEAV